MTRERFIEMLKALAEGQQVELQSLQADKRWFQVRISPKSGHFEFATAKGWKAFPLGADGHEDWRYPSEASFRA